MVKLVYTYALGAYGETRGGPSPLSGTFLLHYFMWFLLFLLLPTPVLAQDSNDLLDQYRTDYFYQRDIYQQNYQQYLNKKHSFDQYRTTTSLQDKIEATKNTLLSQNIMLRSYMMALRTTLNDTPTLQDSLLNYENWLLSQNTTLSNLTTAADFQIWATDFQKTYIPIQIDIYKSLIQQQINHRQKILLKLKDIASRGDVNWDKNFLKKEQDFIEANTEALSWSQSHQFEDRFSPFYEDAQKNLTDADTALKSITLDLKSILIKKSGR